MDSVAGTYGSRPPELLPWPAGWPPPRPARSVLLVLAAAGFTLFDIVVGILALRWSDTGTGVLLLAGSPLMILVTAIGYLTRLRGRSPGTSALRHGQVTDIDEPGLLIPYSKPIGTAAVLLPVSMLVITAPAAAILTAGLIVEGLDPSTLLATDAFWTATVYMGWLLAEIVRKNLSRGLLALTPRRGLPPVMGVPQLRPLARHHLGLHRQGPRRPRDHHGRLHQQPAPVPPNLTTVEAGRVPPRPPHRHRNRLPGPRPSHRLPRPRLLPHPSQCPGGAGHHRRTRPPPHRPPPGLTSRSDPGDSGGTSAHERPREPLLSRSAGSAT